MPPAPRLIADRYEVVSVIGCGSAARTLLCNDLRESRRVVIKELHFAHLSDWKQLELFEREATMLGRLDHPAIPRAFDYFQGDDEAATFHIVQQYIEAPSLLQRMEAGPMLGQDEVHGIVDGLLDVLEYLHGRAPPVLHRDIKPSNILLPPGGAPVLIDFGGVRAAWTAPGSEGATVVGTFGYMAPEQVAGRADPTSDLYSLGATLLHLVTGHPPGDFPFVGGGIEVPSALPTDPSLAGLIRTLLRPDPRDRPASARAARDLLSNPASALTTTPAPTRGVAVSRSPAAMPVVAAPRRAIFGVSGEPRFVHMGDAPRDPHGDLADVYRNLMHPLFPARRPWSVSEHAVWVGFAGFVSVASVGAAPAIYAWRARQRRALYDELFRSGACTTGAIRSNPSTVGGMHTLVRYDFEVGGVPYSGFMQHPTEMTRYWSAGDTVAVLYDPEDPTRSCIVYR